MQLQVKLNLEYETFENIIVTALEGGSNYWYILGDIKGCPLSFEMTDKAPSERIAYGLWHNKDAEVYIHDCEMDICSESEDDGELLGILTYDSVRERMQLATENHLSELESMISGDFDAWTTDTLFQVLVMEEVVFG
jgi:hypothetical protein